MLKKETVFSKKSLLVVLMIIGSIGIGAYAQPVIVQNFSCKNINGCEQVCDGIEADAGGVTDGVASAWQCVGQNASILQFSASLLNTPRPNFPSALLIECHRNPDHDLFLIGGLFLKWNPPGLEIKECSLAQGNTGCLVPGVPSAENQIACTTQ